MHAAHPLHPMDCFAPGTPVRFALHFEEEVVVRSDLLDLLVKWRLHLVIPHLLNSIQKARTFRIINHAEGSGEIWKTLPDAVVIKMSDVEYDRLLSSANAPLPLCRFMQYERGYIFLRFLWNTISIIP